MLIGLNKTNIGLKLPFKTAPFNQIISLNKTNIGLKCEWCYY